MILLFLFHWKPLLAADIGFSTRALGMGNAYTTVVRDSDSLFYNPAGYAKMSGFNWTIADPSLGTNAYSSYQNYIDLFDTNDMATLIRQLYGDSVNAYVGAKSLMSIGGFAFGGYGLADANFQVNNPAYPSIDALYRVDYGLVVGWGVHLDPAKLTDLGIQVRRVTRQGGTVPIGVSTIANLSSQDIENQLNQTGTGYAFDVGVNFSLPGPLKPTASFVWRDMGNTVFTNTSGLAAPEPVEQEMVLGLGVSYESLLMSIRPAIDYRYLNKTGSERQIGNNLHIGVEMEFPLLELRAGFNQGYYTAGLSFDLWFFRVDAATYGVELGAYPGQLEDRRYIVQMSFDFGIGADFSFFNLNGSGKGGSSSSRSGVRSGRKQRR